MADNLGTRFILETRSHPVGVAGSGPWSEAYAVNCVPAKFITTHDRLKRALSRGYAEIADGDRTYFTTRVGNMVYEYKFTLATPEATEEVPIKHVERAGARRITKLVLEDRLSPLTSHCPEKTQWKTCFWWGDAVTVQELERAIGGKLVTHTSEQDGIFHTFRFPGATRDFRFVNVDAAPATRRGCNTLVRIIKGAGHTTPQEWEPVLFDSTFSMAALKEYLAGHGGSLMPTRHYDAAIHQNYCRAYIAGNMVVDYSFIDSEERSPAITAPAVDAPGETLANEDNEIEKATKVKLEFLPEDVKILLLTQWFFDGKKKFNLPTNVYELASLFERKLHLDCTKAGSMQQFNTYHSQLILAVGKVGYAAYMATPLQRIHQLLKVLNIGE